MSIPTESEWKASRTAKLANRLAEVASILAAWAILVAGLVLIESIRAG